MNEELFAFVRSARALVAEWSEEGCERVETPPRAAETAARNERIRASDLTLSMMIARG